MEKREAQELLECCRTEFNAAGAEVRQVQRQLDSAYAVLVFAAERYGAALVATGEDPMLAGLEEGLKR